MRRYLQNNIDFLKTLIFKAFSIISHLCTAKVFQDEKLLNDYGIFWNLKIKNSLCCGWKKSFAFSDRAIFSVLRVWLLFTVTMDHLVVVFFCSYCEVGSETPRGSYCFCYSYCSTFGFLSRYPIIFSCCQWIFNLGFWSFCWVVWWLRVIGLGLLG